MIREGDRSVSELLRHLLQAIEDAEDDMRLVNDQEYGHQVNSLIGDARSLHADHYPVPTTNITRDLDVLFRKLDAFSPPPIDEELEGRTETRRRIRRSVAVLWMTVKNARRNGP